MAIPTKCQRSGCEHNIDASAVEDIVTGKWYCNRTCKNLAINVSINCAEMGMKVRQPTKRAQGVKFDEDKLPFHLISYHAEEALALRLQHGAKKYAPRNWEKGLDWSRCFRAALGHLWAFWWRRDIDPDSGLSHLSGAYCNIMFLIHYTECGTYKDFDDRPLVSMRLNEND